MKDILAFAAMKPALAMLIVDWKRNDGRGDNIKKDEILGILRFAQEHCLAEGFMELKKRMVKNLRTVGASGMQDNIDYGNLAEELFSQLGKSVHLSPEGRGFSDPQTVLESAGVSGVLQIIKDN